MQQLKAFEQSPAVADDAAPPGEDIDAPPGEESEQIKIAVSFVAPVRFICYQFVYLIRMMFYHVYLYSQKNDEETTAVRERIIAIRKKVHSKTIDAVSARWNYEEGVRLFS